MNTMGELPDTTRGEVIDRYGVKLMTSGYSRDQARKVPKTSIFQNLLILKSRSVFYLHFIVKVQFG